MKKSYGRSAIPTKSPVKTRAVLGYMLSVITIAAVPSASARWSYPYVAWRQTSMVAVRPSRYLTMMVAVSYASGPGRSAISWLIMHEPVAKTSRGSSPIRKRDMSRSWIAMSLKMPPPPCTYLSGGGAGSREQSFTTIVSPMVPSAIERLTREKFGSNRRCSAVISFTPLARQRLTALMVSAKSVAIGFSQKMSLPSSAASRICAAWYCDGEQIQTASTSGWLMTSVSSLVHAMPG
mmetsp:Transcript_31554/g.93741  ORF Transcript_31554/g.93741 Transcript_31554/m.93741 type:complete len:236 (+) Transcript_31554:665-1372(+)